ncbi:MAG: beta-lactamase family protein [Phaeodactylibacter sp.]|nr:beta-lactamase family protein [Phaeodactylibacter sp.]MCB9276214.1 beta-lactamase family protein [Lewinellaceae bacterium]
MPYTSIRTSLQRQCLGLCFVIFSTLSHAQPAGYQAAIDSARSLVERMIAFNDIPGLAVSVSVAGKMVWSEGFGYADLEQQVPVRPDRTRFRIGSVSKPLTAAALGKLYDEGKVMLDTPIQVYVPAFPEKRWPVSLRLLAGHLSGIRHYRGTEFLSNVRYNSVSEGLSLISSDSLLFEPGQQYAYSSYGWNLISAAIEGACGQEFLSYMQQAVFSPLGMGLTTADYTDSLIAFRTRYYEKTEGGAIINAPCVDNSYKWAGGGFLSTTEDLLRFGQAHIHPGFLSDTTLNLWLRPMKTTSGEPTNYGMGWAVQLDGTGKKWFGHSGGSIGGITQLLVYPEDEVVVAMLTNSGQVDYGDTHYRIAHLFMGTPIPHQPLDEAALEPYPGDYLLDGDTPARVSMENGWLFYSRRGGLPILLAPAKDGSFAPLSGNTIHQFRHRPEGGLEMVIEVPGRAIRITGVKQ